MTKTQGQTLYRLRRRPTAKGAFMSYEVGVPQVIAERLVDKGFEMFTVELTTDGILYRPVQLRAELPQELPEWLK